VTQIYIPTRGRVGSQVTYDTLVGAIVNTIALVCPPDEVKAHHAEGRAAIACPAQGITATRQFIMDHCPTGKVLMFDDDLRFAVRRLDDPGKFLPAGGNDVRDMVARLESMLDQVPLVGLCNRGGANRVPPGDIPVSMNKRLFDVQCVDAEWFHKNKIVYRQRFMEDFDVSLQALLKGYPTALLTTHTKDNIGGANAGGGCSIYRTPEKQAIAARQLADRWPGFVKVRVVNAKGSGIWSERTDVTVQWAQAAKAGRELRDILGMDQHPTPDWSDLAPEWTLL
jgi:hypothetical protein